MKPVPPAELRELIDRRLGGEALSRPEMGRLEELLEEEDNLAFFVQIAQQEAIIPEVLDRLHDGPVAAPRPRSIVPFLRRLALPAAAVLLFGLGLLAGRMGLPTSPAAASSPEPSDDTSARITGLMGVTWAENSEPDMLARSGSLDRLAIDSGLVEITYGSGVRVTVEGPATYDVLDSGSGRLGLGKLVADVPKGAEGFRIDYADGSVVDLGTEFAMNAGRDGGTDIGVFEGEIEIHSKDGAPISLYQDQAIRHDLRDGEEQLRAVPFQREAYVRRLPSRDFAWEVRDTTEKEVVFDVTHLVWKAADYRAIFKWMNGPNGVAVEDVELRCDGQPVASDPHRGTTGQLRYVKDNVFRLPVAAGEFRSGRWTLHARISAPLFPNVAKGPILSNGVLQFEEGLVTSATESDFVGRWHYRFLGLDHVREFFADGTMRYTRNGKQPKQNFVGSRWTVENGILLLTVPELGQVEKHALRDPDTLIFISNGYENAKRER